MMHKLTEDSYSISNKFKNIEVRPYRVFSYRIAALWFWSANFDLGSPFWK